MNCEVNSKQKTLAYGVWTKVTLREAKRKQKEQKRGLINGLILFSEKEKKGITIRRKDYSQMIAEQKNTQRLNEKF